MALKDLANTLKEQATNRSIIDALDNTDLPKLWSGTIEARLIDYEEVETEKYSGFKMFFVNSNGEPMPPANTYEDMGSIWVSKALMVQWLHSFKRALHMDASLDLDGIIDELSKPHSIVFKVESKMNTNGLRLYNTIDFAKTMTL